MSPLVLVGLAAVAGFLVFRKSEPASTPSPTSDLDKVNGMATAYAYLDSEPKKDVEILVDLKALAGTPLGPMKVTPRYEPIPADLPDGRKGRAMLGSIGGETGGSGVGTVTLYFV